MNASFSSLVLALNERKASATDSLFDLLNAVVDARVEGFGWVPLVATAEVVVGALKRPVQSFGGALADGDVGLTSASSDRADLSASLGGADGIESLAVGDIESLAEGCVAVDSGAVCSETTVREGGRDTVLGTTGRTGTAAVCFGGCLTWVGVAGVTRRWEVW
jgi:hypothetical protein